MRAEEEEEEEEEEEKEDDDDAGEGGEVGNNPRRSCLERAEIIADDIV